MGSDWYDMIAVGLGGYVENWDSTKIGVSGEDVFEQELVILIQNCSSVLDAGCGHGEFTLKMSTFTPGSVVGFDFSSEMIKTAKKRLLGESDITNVEFVQAVARELPFHDSQFDLIYDRRGPLSLIHEHRVLKSGGMIYGIHSGGLDDVKKALNEYGFESIEIR